MSIAHGAERFAPCPLRFAFFQCGGSPVLGLRRSAFSLKRGARLSYYPCPPRVSPRGKGRAAPPPPWFPPLDSSFRGAPSRKGIPKGGNPSFSTAVAIRARRSLFRGRMALSTVPGEPSAALRVTAFAFPSARHSRLSPKRGLPSEKDRDTVVVASCFRYRFSTKPCLSAQSHSLL